MLAGGTSTHCQRVHKQYREPSLYKSVAGFGVGDSVHQVVFLLSVFLPYSCMAGGGAGWRGGSANLKMGGSTSDVNRRG